MLVDDAFGGSLDDLRAARAATDLPLLAKGFFSTEEHLREVREAGADAALLILRDLDDATAAQLMRAADELGLDTLVEAHDEEELAARDAARRPRDRRQRPRPRHLPRSTAPRSSSSWRRLRATAIVVAESAVHTRAQAAAAELAGARRRARRHLADARAGPGREAARAALAAARQGVRADAAGGRRRRGRGGRRPLRLHLRRGLAAPGAGRPRRSRTRC